MESNSAYWHQKILFFFIAISNKRGLRDLYWSIRKLSASLFYRKKNSPFFPEKYSIAQALQDDLDFLVKSLDQSNIQYFIVNRSDISSHSKTNKETIRIGIFNSDKDKFIHVLSQIEKPEFRVFFPGRQLNVSWRVSSLNEHSLRKLGQYDSTWSFYSDFVWSSTGKLIEDFWSCDIEFWKQEKNGIRTSNFNNIASFIPTTNLIETENLFRNKTYKSLEPFTKNISVLEYDFPIDLVYTWVDGSDPVWLKKKKKYLIDNNSYHPEAIHDVRYANHDELKYSLRSVGLYADFIRTIYIITDNQCPTWLDTSNPRIKLIDHKDIFSDKTVLPTFNSQSIESSLHHIADLSEHFIYMNDDIYFCRPVKHDLFFYQNGISKFSISSNNLSYVQTAKLNNPLEVARKNCSNLLLNSTGKFHSFIFQHGAAALNKKTLFELENKYHAEFIKTRASRFRSNEEIIPAFLFNGYSYIKGKAVPGNLTTFYTEINNSFFEKDLVSLLKYRDYDMFCINDTFDKSVKDISIRYEFLNHILSQLFPSKSEFEL